MQYRKFGKLDWQVSALGFGCMRLPVIDGNVANIDQERTTGLIRHAIDAGLNYVDTAYPYHEQKSEIALGIALQDGYRERVRIATKSPVWLIKQAEDFDAFLDEQLKRLQTSQVDFYLFHSLDRDKWKKIIDLHLLEKAESAMADGRIRYLGFSFHDNLEVFKEIVDGYAHWTFCQIQYNYMDVAYQAGAAGLQYAAGKGLAVVVMEPLRGGVLAADLPKTRPIWAQATRQRKPADWALQWLWNLPEVTTVLSGMNTMEQLDENLASAQKSQPGLISTEENKLFDQAREVLMELRPVGCTQCEYCLPCPNGVAIPRIFECYNRIAMYDDPDTSRFLYSRIFAEDEKAKNCIQCGECLPKCPQNIPISDWMPIIEDVLANDQPFVTKL
jgi:predicted aldo/keto reductase-like oxidoreductase